MPAPTPNPVPGRRAARARLLRVFFALWPEAATRDAVAAVVRDVVERTGGRPPRRENLHLTLAFVGEVAPDRLAALERIGEQAARAAASFVLSLDRVGGFRGNGIAWLGAEPVPLALGRLVGALNAGLKAARFRVDERPFAAHVTLARNCRRPLSDETIAPIGWGVERMTLTASDLRPDGSNYRELAAWPLTGTGE